MVMSGGSRGIGLATALAFARRGGNVALLAKTGTPQPNLPGTIHTAVEAIRRAGGRAVGVVSDVRSEEDTAKLIATDPNGESANVRNGSRSKTCSSTTATPIPPDRSPRTGSANASARAPTPSARIASSTTPTPATATSA